MNRRPNPFEDIEAAVEARIRENPRGFSLDEDMVEAMRLAGVDAREIDEIVGRPDVRLAVAGERALTLDASERAARLARIVGLAQKVFVSSEKAFLWLRAPHGQLAGVSPISYVGSESGARFVESTLIRIDHGIAA
ncbi:antitoxin Xre/MbcA/ParS toxin-binding domain-containing protein [Chenggangzhangella methanolivorans]|uniref:DUF2384 domain-containing protein n=1 Tax=Chenggangzhangella methanolivorans TaxID=1437009 RepID=A0A9E6R873_9HYPH|nr:antitoxin Xre/MbcA/ParS toxin-binding domain-containing protein [Chenggangzhangella methanolivorans]QZN99261.1 DUF2384 domain-containing protein [Chenggangzhangella methanolivorans]